MSFIHTQLIWQLGAHQLLLVVWPAVWTTAGHCPAQAVSMPNCLAVRHLRASATHLPVRRDAADKMQLVQQGVALQH